MKETSYLSYRRLMCDNRITIIYREIGLINVEGTREKISEKTEEMNTAYHINYRRRNISPYPANVENRVSS
jgi:hypothetical protein